MAGTTYALPDARRIRSYLYRLPLATRLLLLVLVLVYFAQLIWPGLSAWGALVPADMTLSNLYRFNTYPLIHKNLFHLLFNAIALIPLLERFEAEQGTLVTVLLFTGSFGYLPGGAYTILERWIFRLNSAAVGSSVWVFLLLCNEAIKTYKANPSFTLMDWRIPTWTTPLFLILVINFLIPQTSLLGHLCGAGVGYLWGLGYIRFLAPPEKILRWIEGKLNLLGRLPHYVSVDQKTYGRYGVLPTTGGARVGPGVGTLGATGGATLGPLGSTQRLGT